MTACHYFRGTNYINREPCEAGIDNRDRLGEWPCVMQNQGECDKRTISDEDKPMEWAPVGKHNYEEVKRRSMRTFGDNPNQG